MFHRFQGHRLLGRHRFQGHRFRLVRFLIAKEEVWFPTLFVQVRFLAFWWLRWIVLAQKMEAAKALQDKSTPFLSHAELVSILFKEHGDFPVRSVLKVVKEHFQPIGKTYFTWPASVVENLVKEQSVDEFIKSLPTILEPKPDQESVPKSKKQRSVKKPVGGHTCPMCFKTETSIWRTRQGIIFCNACGMSTTTRLRQRTLYSSFRTFSSVHQV